MTDDPIAELEEEFNSATARARKLVETTEPRLFTVRPNISAWSAAECLAHLSITTDMFLPVLAQAEEKARQAGAGKRRPRMDWIGAVLRWFMEPPVRTKVKTSAPLVPRAIRAKAEALGEFMSLQEKLVDLIHSARDLDISKVKIISPFDKRVRYNIYSAFRIVVAHQRRHLWQAEQAVENLRRMRAA
jgi:hypothetical protein